jgi:hypothetical protein
LGGKINMRKIIATCSIVSVWLSGMIIATGIPSSSINNNEFYYSQRFAVIIVGYYGDKQHYGWFTEDTQAHYDLLIEKYGFTDNDVYLLLTLKEEWADSLHLNPDIIDQEATEENIKTVFSKLKEVITEDDLLYVIVINHGGDDHYLPVVGIDFWLGKFAHDTFFGLEETEEHSCKGLDKRSSYVFEDSGNKNTVDNKIYDHELSNYVDGINARRIIFVLQPCFSGGFINDLSKENHVVITASRERQPAFVGFMRFFYEGLNGKADDSNNDGRISLAEVYGYTARKVYDWIKRHPAWNKWRLQHPLIDDNGDKIGHRYGWFGFDPNDPFKDGYVAAKIFDFTYELF